MVKHNPAYRDGSYVAVATPVPGEDNSTPSKPIPRIASTPRPVHTPTVTESVERPRRAAAAQPATPAPSKLRHSASAAPEVADNPEFNGKTFQQAQEQIVREIIDYVEPEYVQGTQATGNSTNVCTGVDCLYSLPFSTCHHEVSRTTTSSSRNPCRWPPLRRRFKE